MNSGGLRRFLGESPGAAILKFILLSLIVGACLAFWGLTPASLLRSLQRVFEDIFGLGFEALRNAFQYFFYGAMIVGPIWLLTRLLSRR